MYIFTVIIYAKNIYILYTFRKKKKNSFCEAAVLCVLWFGGEALRFPPRLSDNVYTRVRPHSHVCAVNKTRPQPSAWVYHQTPSPPTAILSVKLPAVDKVSLVQFCGFGLFVCFWLSRIRIHYISQRYRS